MMIFMKKIYFNICLIFLSANLVYGQKKTLHTIPCNIDENHEFLIINENPPNQAVSSRAINNLCVTFLVANDAQLTANTSTMNSIVTGINNWLTVTHNPLSGPDYQISNWERIVMPPNYTVSGGGPTIDLTIAGNASGSDLLNNILEWTADLGSHDLAIAIAPNSSGYNAGQAIWLPGENLIGNSNEFSIAVIKSSSNTTINFGTLVFAHEVFGHLQGLDFNGNAHSLQTCNGNTDFINAAPNNLQICSDAQNQIGLANDNGSVICSGILPLELINFQAKTVQRNAVQLDWTTVNEVLFSHFIIEKSLNGVLWEGIGKVEGKGSSNESTEYNFFDDNFSSNQVYYRLQLVDIDGSIQFSRIVSVEIDSLNTGFLINPNPCDGIATIHCQSFNYEDGICLNIFNAQGQILMKKKLDSPSYKLDLSALADGIYYVGFENSNGYNFEKIIIKK